MSDGKPICDGEFPDLEALAAEDMMQALGMLSAGLAHEMKTPLGAAQCAHATADRAHEKLLARLSELAPDALDDPDVRRSLKAASESRRVISTGLERVQELVLHMKQFLRFEEEPGGPVPLAPLVADVLLLVGHQLRERITVETRVPDGLAAHGRRSAIHQIVLNLLLNAAQALRDEGGRIEITASADGDGVILTVADDGPGVPEDLCSRIFELGFTTRAADGGTGFGLALSRKLATKLGGGLVHAATPGGGATFRLSLPARAPEEDGTAAP